MAKARFRKQVPNLMIAASAVMGFSGYLMARDVTAVQSPAALVQMLLDGFYFTFRMFAGIAPETFAHDKPLAAVFLNITRLMAPVSLILAFLSRFDGLWKPLYVRLRLRRMKGYDLHWGGGALSDAMAAQNLRDGRWSVIVDDAVTDPAGYVMNRARRQIRIRTSAFEADLEDTPLAPDALIFTDPDDYANVRAASGTATATARIAARRRFVHIGSETLRQDLIVAGGIGGDSDPVPAQILCRHDLLARHFFHSHDLFLAAQRAGLRRLHLACVGFGDDAAALVYHLIKIGPHPDLAPVAITILADRPETVAASLAARLGDVPGLAEIRVAPFTSGDGAEALLRGVAGDDPVSLWYLGADLAQDARHLALALRSHALREGQGVAPIYLQASSRCRDWVAALPAHPVMPLACLGDGDQVLSSGFFGGGIDDLARALHEGYQGYKPGLSDGVSEAQSLRDWAALDENLKAANRRAADAAKTKLEALGLAGPLGRHLADGVADLDLPAARLEQLAEAEHRSWMADRVINGWRYGVPRDNTRRLHPNLVPYQDLSEADKALDREQILRLRDILVSRHAR